MIYQTNRVTSDKSRVTSSNQAGVTLLLAILILASVLAISFSLATIMFIEVRTSGDLLRTEPALFAATGVAEQALFNLERNACPGNNCYTSGFANGVVLNGLPSLVTNSPAVFTDKVKAGSTNINSTINKYDFCSITAGAGGCQFSKVIVQYITSNAGSFPLKAYLCEFDPNNTTYQSPPCTQASQSQGYWLTPVSDPACLGAGQTSLLADGSAQLDPGSIANCVSWIVDPNLQQQLILVNPSTSSDIYARITTIDANGSTPKGLPYVGKIAVDVNTLSSSVGRKIQVTVPNNPSNSGGATQYSIWNNGAISGTAVSTDTGDYELGVKFRANSAGSVTGVKFYKGDASNGGSHVGHLWDSGGTLLGSVTFSGETASGWQQANFAAPIAISANTTYVISYAVPLGHYSYDLNYFTSAGVVNGPLTALQTGVDGLNGVYNLNPGSFPSSSSNDANYWVDVIFQ